MDLRKHSKVLVHQVFEAFELFGYETRNKYEILDENKQKIGYAAEQGKGVFAFFSRQFLGHWRTFELYFFDDKKVPFMSAIHPFRFYFERLEVKNKDGLIIGALQKRFSILTKRFDVEDPHGNVIMEMRSPFWRIWTFPFTRRGMEAAKIEKKWSGLLAEAFTDKDKFLVSYIDPALSEHEKLIVLAASVFIDIRYFEKKANRN